MYLNKWLMSEEKGLVSAAVINWHPSTGESPRGQNSSPPSQSESEDCEYPSCPRPFTFLRGDMEKPGWALGWWPGWVGPDLFLPQCGERDATTPAGELCVSGNTVYTLWKAGQKKGGLCFSSPCQTGSFHGSATVSLVSPFSCRNKNQPTHPETGLCCLASCAKPWAPPYFFFFWKCSNLQERYKNSTMSTITQILLLALDTLSPLFECICFVKPLLWC